MFAKQWGAAMVVVVVSAQKRATQLNLNAYDDLYGPDAQRRTSDPYASIYGNRQRQNVPELETLMGASQQETQYRLGSYLEEMYDINLELEEPVRREQPEEGHFSTPLVEHYQTRTAHNLSGHVDNAYDEYYHHDPVQDDRLGGEIHTFHESLADFFPDGQDHFDVPLNLQYEGDSGANVWFPMEEGENWLQPRGRRVE